MKKTQPYDHLSDSIDKVARAIMPPDVAPGHDATGGTVDSLVEAVMGITSGLCKIAEAIENLAQAVRESQ